MEYNGGKRGQWLFTYNNYTEEGETALKRWLTENAKYACFQREEAPSTGTPHLQGYMNLKKQMALRTVQNNMTKLGIRLHIDTQKIKGTPQQQRAYCSKPGGSHFFEIGEINEAGQGSRSDLQVVTEKVLGKRSISEIAVEHPETFVRYHKGIKALAFEIDEPPKYRDVEVVLYYGDAGTGKSYKAYNIASLYGPYYELEMPSSGTIYWDGYKGEKSIIISEFKGWISPTQLNRFLDSYKLSLNLKGATTYAKYEHVFITSNYPPEEWWSEKVKWNREALYRRINSIYEFRGKDHVTSIITKIK